MREVTTSTGSGAWLLVPVNAHGRRAFAIIHCKVTGVWIRRGPCPREWEEDAASPMRHSRLGLFVQERMMQTRVVPGGGCAVNRTATSCRDPSHFLEVTGASATDGLTVRCPRPVMADVRAVAAVPAPAGSAWAPVSPLKPPTHM